LRGFSRIGGVLIGREPEESTQPPLDFRDIQWSSSGDTIELKLTRSDGEIIRLGPYRRALVREALAYAADSRVTTVTMVTARPLKDLKILLHPALVDTPIECRAIELDRFVDESTGHSTEREGATHLIEQAHSLYQLAWGERANSMG